MDLFFVLSGFLIVGILLDQRGTINQLGVFYLRRTCRIFPLYFLLLGLFIFLASNIQFAEPAQEWLFGNSLPLWSYATFTQNILMGLQGHFGPGAMAVTWSLAVEEQFYVLIPILVLITNEKRLIWIIPILFLLIPLLRLASPGFHAYVNTPWRADPLLAGSYAAIIVRSRRWVETITDHARRLHFISLILLALVPLMIYKPGILGAFDHTWLALLFTFFILSARFNSFPPLRSLLCCRVLIWIGKHSYGIYMFHQLANGLAHGILKNQAPIISEAVDACITLLALVVTIFSAWLSFRFIEGPIIRFGHRFKYIQN